ncbi:WD40-repeat-containing domain protein [Pyronema domesticum]|uniref:Similar to Uncharacterized WD repeat-containing protein C9G1.05 acc. no. O14301 n=1 Tax=Pyronema omphalodes (strain CBS 100304) TaxID=1076935 RepID=U4LPI2_PYROM|nr:WD40-repeat-containing domain protein [Pyronema domesticum]CCX33487.1 Similar to Uncharacterized WD repeat-containing protein C9G1.05; acc. no. O14301 [Pyronema omphalodes CBS 100304]
MELTRLTTYAPQPHTERGQSTKISVDKKGERIAYACGKSVFIRSIDEPSNCKQYTEHTANVTVARFSPSGFYIASGDVHGKVRVWDCSSEDMVLKSEITVIAGPIKDLAWDADSQRIIAVGNGQGGVFGRAVMFDSGNSVGTITGQSRCINSVSIRQQRPFRAALASDDTTVAFYNFAPAKLNTTLGGPEHHTNAVQGVAFSPDGAYFVSVGADKKIFLFDGKEGTKISSVENAHGGSILSVSWSPDSKRFVTSSAYDRTVKIWEVDVDTKTPTSIKTWTFDHQQVSVVWTPRADDFIISVSLNGDFNYLSPTSDTPLRVIQGHKSPIKTLSITGTQTSISGDFNGAIYSYDLSKGVATSIQGSGHGENKIITGLIKTPRSIFSIGWDDHLRTIIDGKFTAGIATDAQPIRACLMGSTTTLALLTTKELRVYTLAGPQPSVAASLKLDFAPTSLSASSNGEIAVTTGEGTPSIFIYSYSSGAITKKEQSLPISHSVGTALSYSPGGTHLAAGDGAGKIFIFTTNDYKKIATLTWNTARIEEISWNSRGSHIAVAGLDEQIVVYEASNAGHSKNARMAKAHQGGVNTVKWEHEGNNEATLVSAGADATVKRWKLKM